MKVLLLKQHRLMYSKKLKIMLPRTTSFSNLVWKNKTIISVYMGKDHLADLMAHWVCRSHNLYFAQRQRSVFFVRLALLYIIYTIIFFPGQTIV